MESKDNGLRKVDEKQNYDQAGNVDKVSAANKQKFSDPVYKQLSRINGEINRMHKDELQSRLAALQLDTRGNKEILKKRMKYYYKKTKLIKARSNDGHTAVQHFDYFCVIDFEATCEEPNPTGYQHEIIEFPAVLVNVQDKEIVDEFHEYCRPTLHPILTPFCTQLTGITQDQVDNADTFSKVLERFEEWLRLHQLGTDFKFIIVTDGPWDMGRFLHTQCGLSRVEFPSFGKKWVNIRKTYSNFYQCKRLPTEDRRLDASIYYLFPTDAYRKFCDAVKYCEVSLKQMLELLGLQFVGRPHRGIDDARNITRILVHLLNDGACLRVNERIDLKTDQDRRVVPVNRKPVAVHSSPVENWQPPLAEGHQFGGSVSSEEDEISESVDPDKLSDIGKFCDDWPIPPRQNNTHH